MATGKAVGGGMVPTAARKKACAFDLRCCHAHVHTEDFVRKQIPLLAACHMSFLPFRVSDGKATLDHRTRKMKDILQIMCSRSHGGFRIRIRSYPLLLIGYLTC